MSTIATNARLGTALLKALALQNEHVTSLVIALEIALEIDKAPTVHVTTLVRDESTKALIEALAQYELVPKSEIEETVIARRCL
jgi:hypothetical protein